MKALRASVPALIVALALSPGAEAGRRSDRPPRTALVVATSGQDGSRYSSEWPVKDGRSCSIVISDGAQSFEQDALPYFPNDPAVIYIDRPDRPKVELTMFRLTDTNGEAIGPSEELAVTLEPETFQGRHFWGAHFSAPTSIDYYLDLEPEWPGDGCGTQSASYTFHMRVTP